MGGGNCNHFKSQQGIYGIRKYIEHVNVYPD